jgi:hypothetical protein
MKTAATLTLLLIAYIAFGISGVVGISLLAFLARDL